MAGTTYRRRRRRRTRANRKLLVLALVAVGLLAAFILLPGVGGPAQLPADSDLGLSVPTMAQPEQETVKPLKISAETAGIAALSDAYIYGTHLGLAGSLTPADAAAVTGLQLVLRTPADDEVTWPLQFSAAGGALHFTLSEKINGGIDLENIAEGEGCLLVRAAFADGTAADWLLTAGSLADLPFTYYTVTRGGANRCITLASGPLRIDKQDTQGLVLRCAAATLPEDVYDIVIDPGHGGTDGGAAVGDANESVTMLDMAVRLRDKLTALGYKVLLTRDGTEDPQTMMAYTMYDADGRVNVTAGSGAKLCLSLHLNTYEGRLEHGGVQIYAADHMDYAFAADLADSVAQKAGTYISPMTVFRVAPGVYSRVFTQADSDELNADCVEHDAAPYNVPAGTNYYFIIRETGGRITGAYVDGRHPHYGSNIYRDSAIGVETYLCELGYISLAEDRQNILTNPDGYAEGLAAAVQARFG